ncbi:hypothetical protein JHS3_05720 [Jeongeupia sp. HS-3]|uniref:hypothetical protein n=1 Tax=Jeongeupia sp. HS-3 TaxID=1009682 RepID=UPI0018A62A04|nr:hypothetical protein [Jeongeupia sp. HS-3]BCL74836.1 hypothetical protein JHS3_05720 [Jeongeupia sp. HS-3]
MSPPGGGDTGEENPGLSERLSYALLGALFGAIYGVMLAVLLAWLLSSGTTLLATVLASTGMFAVLGFVRGPVIGDLVGALAWFWYGVFSAFSSYTLELPAQDTGRVLKTLFYVGLATGMLVWLAI